MVTVLGVSKMHILSTRSGPTFVVQINHVKKITCSLLAPDFPTSDPSALNIIRFLCRALAGAQTLLLSYMWCSSSLISPSSTLSLALFLTALAVAF